MLVPDEHGWPQDIAGIGVLGGEGLLADDGTLRIERVRAHVAGRLHLVPRFRQVLVEPRRGLGVPFWTDARRFDLADHVRVRPLAASAGEAELIAACEELRARRIDRSRPLWELWLLPGLADRRVGLFIKLHHVLADGISGLAQVAAFLDASPGVPIAAPAPWAPRRPPSTRALLLDNVRRRSIELGRPLRALRHPLRTASGLRRWQPVLRELLGERGASVTSLTRRIGPRRRIALVRTDLGTMKAIARAHAAKVNDVLLALVAGGARELLRRRGERVADLVLRVVVPISLHADRATARGNDDAGMLVPLVIGDPDDARRLRAISADTARRKREARPRFAAISFPGTRAVLHVIYGGIGHQRLVNLYAANVPGPPARMFLAGAPLLELFPVVPLAGTISLGVGALSYAGAFTIGIVADRDACPDLEVFASGLRRSLQALARSSAWAPRSA